MLFEKSIFYDQNDILGPERDKSVHVSPNFIYMLFLHLKFRFGHKKWTSQKACLEVHTTVSKDSRAKKRFSVLWVPKNRRFLYFSIVFGSKSRIFGHPQHSKSFFVSRIFRNGRMDF